MRVRGSIKSALLFVCAFIAAATSVAAQDSSHIDVNNLFPSLGALVIWVEPNDAGVPPGILAILPGALIHDRVLVTCGHCTRAAEPGIPPFIKRYVTFNLHVLDDRSTWIPVEDQAWHPSTFPCGPDNACHWPEEPFPDPGLSDVGLVLLSQPVKSVKPAKLPQRGTLDRGHAETQEQVVVTYTNPEGIRRYRVVAPSEVWDDRWIQGSAGEACTLTSGSIRFFGPLGESGNQRRTALATLSGFAGKNCATGRSGFARLDNDDVLSWIDQQIKQWLAGQ
jgi:hypothetical protein